MEQYRPSMLLTGKHSQTANATVARDMDIIQQFAERRPSASSVLVITIHANTNATPAKPLERSVPTQF